jgi:hypothetical protein
MGTIPFLSHRSFSHRNHAGHLHAEFSKTGACHQSHITGTDYSDIHHTHAVFIDKPSLTSITKLADQYKLLYTGGEEFQSSFPYRWRSKPRLRALAASVKIAFMSETFKKGVLYVVSTPIGNMEDITLRALRLLKSVDLIAAEDTRHTKHLLTKYIFPPSSQATMITTKKKTPVLIQRLKEVKASRLYAMVTPGISDPGFI